VIRAYFIRFMIDKHINICYIQKVIKKSILCDLYED